ncbi:MAG: exosome complex RNA-binding protein Csl4 [Thermoplasmatota archaeon]
MEEQKDKLVMPGDKIGTSEEWLPGEGAYEDEGYIYASVFGKVIYDDEKLEAKVTAINPISSINKGDVVYGTVRDNRGSIASVTLELVEGNSRGISMDIEGSLHISKISNDYVESVEDSFKKGDIIRAKVIQTEPSIQLSTTGKNLGVVRGYCTNCRRPMTRKNNKLYCSTCERTETRKISKAYGKIKLKER